MVQTRYISAHRRPLRKPVAWERAPDVLLDGAYSGSGRALATDHVTAAAAVVVVLSPWSALSLHYVFSV